MLILFLGILVFSFSCFGQDIPEKAGPSFVGFKIEGTAQGGILTFQFSQMFRQPGLISVPIDPEDDLNAIFMKVEKEFKKNFSGLIFKLEGDTIFICGVTSLGLAGFNSTDPGIRALPALEKIEVVATPDSNVALSWNKPALNTYDKIVIYRNFDLLAIVDGNTSSYIDDLTFLKTRRNSPDNFIYEIFGFVGTEIASGIRSELMSVSIPNPLKPR
jgi:hypothetical protein